MELNSETGAGAQVQALPMPGTAVTSASEVPEITVATLQQATITAPATEPERTSRLSAVAAAAGTLGPIECEAVLTFMKNVTGLSIGALRSEAAKGSRRGDDHLAHARATVKKRGPENLLYAQSHFWLWDGAVWRRRDDIAVSQEVIGVVEATGEKVTNALVESVTGLVRKEVFQPDHRFNLGEPDTVNLANCELELVNGQWHVRPHRRELYRTTILPVAHDPAAPAPRFCQFLYEVFAEDADRDDKIRSVLQMIGYSCVAHARHERFALLIGNGANGKSALLRVIEALVGRENVAAVKPSQFDNRFQRAHLHMKLVNVISELPEGKVIADDELKAIVSGEISTVEMKNRDPFDMRAFCTNWFGTNFMPHTRDFSDGLYRRALVLTFNRTFAPHEQDKNLSDKLAAELPGILNLALLHYAYATQHGFTDPPSSIAAREEWRREADQVRCWVAERTDRDPLAEVEIAKLYADFETWARSSGVRQIVGKVSFGKRLRSAGFSTKHSGGTIVQGLKLKPGPDGTRPVPVFPTR